MLGFLENQKDLIDVHNVSHPIGINLEKSKRREDLSDSANGR
jgi:hypothetical protein